LVLAAWLSVVGFQRTSPAPLLARSVDCS